MKITKSELKQIIKEEALKFKKKLQLESQLAEVQAQLDEVKAGNMHELPDGTMKYKPEFEKLSKDGGYPALKEDACEEGDAVEETVEEGDACEENDTVEETIEEEACEESDAVEEGDACEEQTLEEMLAEIMAEDDVACEESDAVEEGDACEEGTMEEEEKTGFEGAEMVELDEEANCEEGTMEEEEKTGFEGAEMVELDEESNCEEGMMEEGWLRDLLNIDEKKAEARAAAKQEIEDVIKAGKVLKWKGKDTLKMNKVVRDLTDEEKSEKLAKVEKYLDVAEKNFGYNADFFLWNHSGDGANFQAMEAGPKTKLGRALAAIGGAAAGATSVGTSESVEVVSESTESTKTVLTEEKARMQQLAGLIKE